ncbi:MAG: hypothetical protein A2V86_14680 [Deltaproteobacteria bacterium RBG_16_49_23]|nr:MAG: hypothetical protein A2V86_14680 [Deltaproteobacteria bacterium RBG_16_49_23]
MDKARLDWVISGLNQHGLTKAEDVFLKTASEDFDRNQALTEKQEERMEALYKQKSQLTPDKNRSASNGCPKKGKPRRPGGKTVF